MKTRNLGKLKLYRRHKLSCEHKHKGRAFESCHCPIWIQGTWEGVVMRHSLDVDTWQRAQELQREIESGKKLGSEEAKPAPAPIITIEHATKAFIKDCESRNLHRSTLGKYTRLAKRLADYGGTDSIASLDGERVRAFRSQWTIGARTASKELERLRAFFRFCIDNGWLEKDPSKGIKPPQVKTLPRLPFDEKEIHNIIAQAKDDKELAFILTLRHTGLRIGDASLLRVSQFDGERIHLYTTKAGVPVSILLPGNLVSLLKQIPPHGGYFFLRGDSLDVHSVSNCWRKVIKRMCKDAGIMPDHPHRFRHSLASDLLMKGASVEDVAAILGNSPAIVIKHYSQWIRGRQERLDSFLEKTWETPKLVRVK